MSYGNILRSSGFWQDNEPPTSLHTSLNYLILECNFYWYNFAFTLHHLFIHSFQHILFCSFRFFFFKVLFFKFYLMFISLAALGFYYCMICAWLGPECCCHVCCYLPLEKTRFVNLADARSIM